MTLAVLLGTAAASAAQQPASSTPDARWVPWLGCWQQLEESIRSESVPDALLDREMRPTAGVVVCVTPSKDPAAITLTTVIEKQSAIEETMFADGAEHPITELGCEGSQRADWSSNGRRLYAKAELTCADGARRTISGLTTIGPKSTWVDIQVVTTEGRESIRVRRYRRAADQSRVADRVSKEQLANAVTAAARQATPLNLDEVKEAVKKTTPSTIEAVLVETHAGFPLNAKRLQELDAAGVPDRVLDLMVALSFPDKFVVERRASAAPSGGSLFDNSYGLPWIGAYDLWPYHYSPFLYGMWGDPYYYGYYSTPVTVIVDTPNTPQPSGEGRVIDGLGYTRVRSREPQVTAGGSDGGSGGGGSTTGGSSSGGGVSSQGYSGGGGGDSGRTAVPRPPQ